MADCARDVGGHDARWKRLTGKPVGSASEGSAIRTPTTKSLCQGVYGSYHFCEQDLSDASERWFRDLNEMLKRTALNAGVSESEFELPLYELVLTSETGPVHRVLLLRVSVLLSPIISMFLSIEVDAGANVAMQQFRQVLSESSLTTHTDVARKLCTLDASFVLNTTSYEFLELGVVRIIGLAETDQAPTVSGAGGES